MSISADLNRIFNDIKSKNIEQKEKASDELKANMKNYQEQSEEIYFRIQKLINSSDSGEKMGGLIALDRLTSVITENQLLSFVNKFLSVTFQQFQLSTDIVVHKKTAEVFGKLLKLGGTKIAQVVESDVDEALRWLKTDVGKEHKKLVAILALKELLIEAPYITFNRVFGTLASFLLIWNLIRDKRIDIRKETLDFFNESIKQISQREPFLQQEWLVKIYSEVKKTLSSTDPDVIHGNILTLKSLLSHSREELFVHNIEEISRYILQKKDLKHYHIQIAVIETIPILAKFGKGAFVLEFLGPSLQHLLIYANQTKIPKDKALCYSTLAEIFTPLDESFIKDHVKNVAKNILDELKTKTKPLCVETLKCLESITTKFRKKIIEHMEMQVLVDSILLNGLTQQSVSFLLHLTKLNIPTLSEHIQCKLLFTISFVLAGKIYPFFYKENLDKVVISRFQQSVLLETNNTDLKSNEAKGLAIQTLSNFNFDAYDSLALFVKDTVLPYLDNSNPMIRKAAAKAGCLLYIKKERTVGQQMISKNLMYEIMEKFMSVAISDPDVEIRQTMLSSLNQNFDFYLNSASNLRKLFLCVNDTNEKIQELALIILCRLSKENPSDVVPFLKKTLFQYLSSLSFDYLQKEKQIIQLVNLLSCMIQHGKELILTHSDNIAQILLKHLKDSNTSNVLIPSLLGALSQLCKQSEGKMNFYLDEIIPILMSTMQDKSYTKKRESAIRTFVDLVKSTGFVILPYYKYLTLLENILNLMRIEMNLEMRGELLRLIGCLGAVDYFTFKRVNLKTKEIGHDVKKPLTFDEIRAYGLAYPFKFIQPQNEIKPPQKNMIQELHSYYDDILLVGNFNDQKKMFLHLSSIMDEKSSPQQLSTTDIITEERKNYLNNEVEELIKTPNVIALNSPDYYYTITIKTLLKVLCDSSLQNHHDLAIETLKLILGTLKGRTAHFLYLIIPVFMNIISMWELTSKEKLENLLRLIEKIIRHCERSFNPEFIDDILKIFLKYAPDAKLTPICFEILNTLISLKKSHLKYKIEPIIRVINSLLNGEENKDLTKKALTIYKNLEELLDGYLSVIIPFLCKLCTKDAINMDIDICKEVAILFNSFATSCPCTVQYLSLMVHTLLQLLDKCQFMLQMQAQSIQSLQESIMCCFVVFILKYRNNFLVYLPLVNLSVSKHKIYHNNYTFCIENFLTYGNLEEMGNLPEEQNPDFVMGTNLRTTGSSYTIIDAEFNPPFRKVDPESIKNEFDTSQKTLKEDWIEWMRKSSVELLRQSPNPILAPCSTIAEVYSHISQELYNIAFASCWSSLNDKQKEFIIKQLHNAISAQNIPTNILQTILNLAEFMQHDKEGLQIDNSTLGDLAERCIAYSKALYYREMEFETASEKTVESLISLYSNLGQPEAASGLLVYAKKNFSIELEMSCFENLQRWEDALNDYRMKQLNLPPGSTEDYFVPKLRCLYALSDWDVILNLCEPLMMSEKHQDIEKRRQVVFMAANASLNLGQWDKLEKYVDIAYEDQCEKSFLSAVISIQKEKLDEATLLIKKTREAIDSKMSGIMMESYGKAYENVLKLQQLFELEEIIDMKTFKEKIDKETKPEFQADLLKQYDSKKDKLKKIWEDRLNGSQRSIDVWQKSLAVRSLLLSKNENTESWLKFSKIAMHAGQLQLCRRTLDALKEELNKDPRDQYDYPGNLVIANLECEYKMGVLSDKEIVEKMNEFLIDPAHQVDNRMKSKCYFKLGFWMKEKTEELTDKNIEEIQLLFSRSIQYNSHYYKAWHLYASINFEAVESFYNRPGKLSIIVDKHILYAVTGFARAISLKGKSMFQDSLRLLNLVFKYGDKQEIAEEFRRCYKIIDIISWIEVVPQIIARIDISNNVIQELLHELLVHISRHHPQTLLYQLTVAAKSKSRLRKEAAEKILKDIKNHSANMVKEAILISEELIRTAILLKEQWHEGIEEAWKFYSSDKNIEAVIKTLLGLHLVMKEKPESLSEISFHQNFRAEINEAEAWLHQFMKNRDEICLNQAFDIYCQIYRKISVSIDNLKKVHLQNVAPKLLDTKNCEISVPGLYKPNKPIIRISGFSPELPVLTSKQHPRKLCIYGSDGKDYHFLLKGHEDLRQDERVMQLFSLVNKLLNNEPETEKKDLTITRYSVIPLSTNTGLIGWVQNCDTLQLLIREYRENSNIRPGTETNLMQSMCSSNYEILCLPNKVEIFRHILENTKGEDLQKVLWLKSPNSEIWLEKRTNYIRSLATMSMVGYILGLGDRHPSNIMLQKYTGKIVHIDFGDCWEVAMKREKFPERVPFRLTRMLVKAMEACGIEGNYRNTCEIVMTVLRENKESLLAVLESFVYDPLLNWRLLTLSAENKINHSTNKDTKVSGPAQHGSNMGSLAIRGASMAKISSKKGVFMDEKITDLRGVSPKRKETGREKELLNVFADEEREKPQEILNQKALAVLDRLKKKLAGKDFKETETLSVVEQVNKLIKQATSHENISQAYLGWCPFW